jgi:hypothetical protein
MHYLSTPHRHISHTILYSSFKAELHGSFCVSRSLLLLLSICLSIYKSILSPPTNRKAFYTTITKNSSKATLNEMIATNLVRKAPEKVNEITPDETVEAPFLDDSKNLSRSKLIKRYKLLVKINAKLKTFCICCKKKARIRMQQCCLPVLLPI